MDREKFQGSIDRLEENSSKLIKFCDKAKAFISLKLESHSSHVVHAMLVNEIAPTGNLANHVPLEN